MNPVSGQNLPASTVSSDGARLDVAADGFWGSRNERAFFDVRVFNPLAPSNSTTCHIPEKGLLSYLG